MPFIFQNKQIFAIGKKKDEVQNSIFKFQEDG